MEDKNYNVEEEQEEYTAVEEEDSSTIEEIKNPFDPKKIDIDSKPMSMDLLIKRLRANPPEIDLYPDFQRKSGIWNDKKQSRLIESMLIRLPLPAFYFDGTDDDKWLVVDGLQRLTTINRFVITGELKLKNMEFLDHLNGLTYKELPREFQRRIEEAQIIAYIIKPGTPAAVKFNIFQRINTGGEPLTAQEIRHALNQGLPATFVAELANVASFRNATNNINPDRMLDRDFVTRFISFYLIPYKEYEPDLDSFLNKGMQLINELNEDERKELRIKFELAMKTSEKLFGRHAFRKRYSMKKEERRRPLNKALFDVWSVALAKLTKKELDKLIERKNKVESALIDLMKSDEEFTQAISQATGDKSRVVRRFDKTKKLIQQILNTDDNLFKS